MIQLREEVLELRGVKFTVRELTSKRKAQWGAMVVADRHGAQYSLASILCVDPPLTLQQWEEMPSEVTDAIADCGLRLSGMDDLAEKKA